jgi:hypothetical protein
MQILILMECWYVWKIALVPQSEMGIVILSMLFTAFNHQHPCKGKHNVKVKH